MQYVSQATQELAYDFSHKRPIGANLECRLLVKSPRDWLKF